MRLARAMLSLTMKATSRSAQMRWSGSASRAASCWSLSFPRKRRAATGGPAGARGGGGGFVRVDILHAKVGGGDRAAIERCREAVGESRVQLGRGDQIELPGSTALPLELAGEIGVEG